MAHECEHQVFAEKLHHFRGTLASSEQQVLDAMVLAACRASTEDEVAGYALSLPLTPIWNPFTLAVAERFGLGAAAPSLNFECTWQGCIDIP